MYSHAFAHSHTNIVHVCLTFLSLPDYLNSHCFAKQRTIKLYPFLNHPFLHRVPTPGSTPPLKEFEREALICWVRFSTAHTFLSLSFLFLSFSGSLETLAQSQTWSAGGPPAGAGAACLLSSDYTFASCFPKSPECRHGAASCRRTSRCRGTHKNQLWGQPDPSFPATCRDLQGSCGHQDCPSMWQGLGVTCLALPPEPQGWPERARPGWCLAGPVWCAGRHVFFIFSGTIQALGSYRTAENFIHIRGRHKKK